MLFKHPQLLWALCLLLIPILIHLLQLRRFKPTPFTNVRLLQKVKAKSQKSQTLKRYLLLATRMALFTALILAFAQPFTANTSAFKTQELVIYLDNSFSMQGRLDNSSLLEEATQELINSIPEDTNFSLFTNDREFRNVTIDDIRNSLLQLTFSPDQLALNEIQLKASTYFSQDEGSLKKLILLSDFQASIYGDSVSFSENVDAYAVPLRVENLLNISIDSVFLQSTTASDNNLVIQVSANHPFGSTPVSLYNREQLIAKSAVNHNPDDKSELLFSLPRAENIEGVVSISDMGLTYDNEMYFNINTREKIKVLAVGIADDQFLSRLYGDQLSEYTAVQSVDQATSLLPDQDLLILNQITSLPVSAADPIREFVEKGGSLLVIPSMNMETGDLNRLLTSFGITYGKKNTFPTEITGINYAHPLFSDVFEERVKNFDYPLVQEFFDLNGRIGQVLTFANEQPFLASSEKVYVFSSSLDPTTSNFTSSPLVVPALYAMAIQSRNLLTLYYQLGSPNSVDIPEQLGEDRILSLSNGELNFIPRQQAVGRKTRLWFSEIPSDAGIYTLDNAQTDRSLSFNYPRRESKLSYLNVASLEAITRVNTSIAELFREFENSSAITSLWKWFAILALLFILAEVIIQKVLK